MKPRLLLLLTAFQLIYATSNAQDKRAFDKGNSIISVGYGIGNIWKTFLEDAVSYPDDTYKVSNNGTYTLIYEYGVSKKVSVGLAIGFSEVEGNFIGFGEKFTEKLTNLSVLARANYHIGNFKNFDPYLGGGIGYYHFNYSNDRPGLVNSKVPGAFGYSAQLGLRYYFSSHWAAFGEAGYVGGSLVQLGATFKL